MTRKKNQTQLCRQFKACLGFMGLSERRKRKRTEARTRSCSPVQCVCLAGETFGSILRTGKVGIKTEIPKGKKGGGGMGREMAQRQVHKGSAPCG